MKLLQSESYWPWKGKCVLYKEEFLRAQPLFFNKQAANNSFV